MLYPGAVSLVPMMRSWFQPVRLKACCPVFTATVKVLVAVFVVVVAGLFVVVAQIGVVLHPMHHRGGHMRPLVQIQYAEGVEGEGEGE